MGLFSRLEGPRRTLARTLTAVATTAAIAYGAHYVYQEYIAPPPDENSWFPFWNESSSESTRPLLDPNSKQYRARRKARIYQCGNDTAKAFAGCWPSLGKVIEASTSTTQQTKQLKLLRQSNDDSLAATIQQEELWQSIQLETLTRLITTVYASSLVILSLTVQIHWVGGQIFQNANQPSDTDTDMLQQQQQVLLQTHAHVLEEGIPSMLQAIRSAIRTIVLEEEQWKPTMTVSIHDVNQIFTKVHARLALGGANPPDNDLRNWIRWVLPEPPVESHSLLEALWDLAESPAWQDAQWQVLQETWNQLQEDQHRGWSRAFSIATLPVAKLLASFKSSCTTSAILPATGTTLTTVLQNLPAIIEVGQVSFQAASRVV